LKAVSSSQQAQARQWRRCLHIAQVGREALDSCHRWLIFKKFDNVGDIDPPYGPTSGWR
jgi:hypothetical protein